MIYLIDTKKLKGAVYASGLTFKKLAEKIGISQASMSKKTTGKRTFDVAEAYEISQVLGLDQSERDEIFFAQSPDKKSGAVR